MLVHRRRRHMSQVLTRISLPLVALNLLLHAAYASAPVGRYSVNAGTVFDTKTKLTWQQAAPQGMMDLAAAKNYCPTLSATLGGTGWRVPTIKELQSIIDYSQSAPAIDQSAFPGTTGGGFLSISQVIRSGSGCTLDQPPCDWRISFGNGSTGYNSDTVPALVRCVR